MRQQATLLLNVAAAIQVPLIAGIVSALTQVDESLTALLAAFLWLALFLPLQYPVVLLVLPYAIGIFAGIYQTNLSFNWELLSKVLMYGERSYTSAAALDVFVYFYCPLIIISHALGRRMRMINDLCRYGLWHIGIVRILFSGLLRVLVLVDAVSEFLHKIILGLLSRYLDLGPWVQKVIYFRLWAPGLLKKILITELHRYEYLRSTGISIRKIRCVCAKGLLWKEKAMMVLLSVMVSLYSLIHWSLIRMSL